jgi:serine phosphatase RsbU (regulator of sigma subunit)
MTEHTARHKTFLEVVIPGHPQQSIPVSHSPFLIGRRDGTGNHLELDEKRISRRCAAIVTARGGHRLEDRGNHAGIFVNGVKVAKKTLHDGDTIGFGCDDACTIRFRSSAGMAHIEGALKNMNGVYATAGSRMGSAMGKLKLLLEATSLLHSHLPLDAVLGHMLDDAIAVTKADRGLLLEAGPGGKLKARLARSKSGEGLPLDSITPNQVVLDQALREETGVVTGDPELAEANKETWHKRAHVHPHSFIAAPLYALAEEEGQETEKPQHGELLGVIYLDSTHPAAFSELVRHIFDALAVEAASILENARHMEREHERRLLEHEMGLARAIQQALLPTGFREYPHLSVTGINHPCIDVGGDYFDSFPINENRTAVLIADVSGHGLGAALLTTMLQGALSGMTLGEDPVRVFNQINQFLCEHSEVGHYATMFFSLLDRDGTLHYIKAAHPSPLLLRRGKVTELYTEGSFPVGLIPSATFHAEKVKLEPGDTLVLFSDGVTEAEDPEEKQYGIDRLRELLTEHEHTPLDELKKIILEAVDCHCRGAAQADDITVLLARYSGNA